MKKTHGIFHCFIFGMLLLASCTTTVVVKKAEPASPTVKRPVVAEIEINVGSIDLSKYSKRIESSDIRHFAEVLRKEKIDILAMQGISRYPGVAGRADIVEELSRLAELRNAFGEMMTLSGRQTGNAVFCVYPVISSVNLHYEKISSTNFEAALLAVVDCGARDITVVSTLLPEKGLPRDLQYCVEKLNDLPATSANSAFMIAGNLPGPEVAGSSARYQISERMNENAAQRFWYSNDGSLKLTKQRVIETGLGAMSVAQFGVYKRTQP